MNEEKMYAVMNDKGKWSDSKHFFGQGAWATPDKTEREEDAKMYGGHVVTLIEEPEKVVLTKEQAKIVDDAHRFYMPACYIHAESGEEKEELLMRAYVNGYTVEKEKKYMVELDGLVTTDGVKQYLTKKDGKWFACRKTLVMYQSFTDEELNVAPEWAQQLNREEVTDDEQ